MKTLLRVLCILSIIGILGNLNSCAAPEKVCEVNATQACTCGTQSGTQTCKSDGTGFDSCQCSGNEKVVTTETSSEANSEPGVEPFGPEPGVEPVGPEPGSEPASPESTKDASTEQVPEEFFEKAECDPKTQFVFDNECFSFQDFCLGQTTNPNFPQFRSKFTKDAVNVSHKVVLDPNTKEPIFCETNPGYYYLPGFGYGICDNDKDGWINLNAFRAVDSTDPLIKANARCTLLKVDAVQYTKNDLVHKEGTSNTSYHHFPNPVSLVETIRNDGLDDLIKMPVYTKDQAPLPTVSGSDCDAALDDKQQCPTGKQCCTGGKVCYIGHCVEGRRFEAKEINTMTKACIAGIDLNDNQLNDANERPSDTPNPSSEFEPLLKFGYFLALHFGYHSPDLVVPDPTDDKKRVVRNVWVLSERGRTKSPEYAYVQLQAREDPNGFQPDYWRSCGLRDDQQCTDVTGKIRRGLSSCWLKDIKRATPSLFKCVSFDSNTNKDLQDGFFHPDNYTNKYDRTICSFNNKHTNKSCKLKACAQDSDCLANETCRRKVCHPDKVCATDADCGKNQSCSSKQCTYNQSIKCFSDSECTAGQTCGGLKICRITPCGQNSDCPSTEECLGSTCHPTTPCTKASDCGTNQTCSNKKCYNQVVVCVKDSDCNSKHCDDVPGIQQDLVLKCSVDDGTKKPNPAKKEVGWAVVRFSPYEKKEDYLAGCIDEKAHQICGDLTDAKNQASNLAYLNHEVGSYGMVRATKDCCTVLDAKGKCTNPAGVGECRTATQACSGGTWYTCGDVTNMALRCTCPQRTTGQKKACPNGLWPSDSCKTILSPAKEICDNKDNDCNGKVDELSSCACAVNSTRACGSKVGECKQGTQTCNFFGTTSAWGPCTGSTTAKIEVCDGKDNDCDGQIDERFSYPRYYVFNNDFYRDADGDGYGDKTLSPSFNGCYEVGSSNKRYCDSTTHKCQAIPANFVANKYDCCDKDKNAKPNQKLYFASANQCGNFDYDCNGTATPEKTICNCSNQMSFYNEPDYYAYRSYSWQGSGTHYGSNSIRGKVSPSPYKNTTSCELDGNAKVGIEPISGFSHYVSCSSGYHPTCKKTTTISSSSNVSWWNLLKKSTNFPQDSSNLNYLMWEKSKHSTGCLFKLDGTRPTCGDRTSYAAPGISASTLRFPKTKFDGRVLFLNDHVGCGRCSGCCPVSGKTWYANRIQYEIRLKWQYRTYSNYVFTSKPNNANITSVKCR